MGNPAGTTFRRYRMEPITLGSVDLVKDWLLTKGWVPDEYQKKKIGFEWVTAGRLTITSCRQRKVGVPIVHMLPWSRPSIDFSIHPSTTE